MMESWRSADPLDRAFRNPWLSGALDGDTNGAATTVDDDLIGCLAFFTVPGARFALKACSPTSFYPSENVLG
jgi:hypothetical protein